MLFTLRFIRHAALLGALAATTTLGCGGSSPEPKSASPDPSLEDDDAEASGPASAAPSSGKVKEGMDAIQAGDFAKAKGILEAAVAENAKDPQAVFYLGVAVEGLGDTKGAAANYQKALALDPKLVEASANLSGVLLDDGDAAGALKVAEDGLKRAPKNTSLLRNRAVAMDATGDKGAKAAFEAALAAAPKDEELHYLYAEALLRGGDAQKAAAELKRLTRSDDVAVLASAGRLLGKLKAFDDCIAALDRAVSKKDVAELRVDRGLCKHGKKDDAGALADFEAAIKSDPKFAPAHYYLGQQKRAQGDKKGAKAELEKAAELDPQGSLGQAAKKAAAELK